MPENNFVCLVLVPVALMLTRCFAFDSPVASHIPQVDNLSAAIKTLSAHIKAETHLFINLNETCKQPTWSNALQQHADGNIPLLIVTALSNATNYEIYFNFNSKLLTIAFVDMQTMLQVRAHVNRILWRLHFLHVLFVFVDGPSSVELSLRQEQEQTALFSLFTACWQHGFTQVLAYFSGNGRLYTYHPFPKLAVVRLTALTAYQSGEHLLNFHRYPLRSPISNSSPRIYHYTDRSNNRVTSGYFYKIVLTFIEHHNGTFEELIMPTYDLNFSDILTAFAAKQIDIAANLYYMNDNYSGSHVMMNYNVYIMAPYAQPIPAFYYFMRPFTGPLWALVFCLITYAAILLSLINWRQRQVRDFGATLLEVINSILFLPHVRRRARTRIQFLTFVMLLLVGFLLTNFYVAKLSSLLAIKVYGHQIDSFAEIANMKLMLPQTEYDRRYLLTISKIHPNVLNRIWLTTPAMVHMLRRDLNTSYLHSGVEDKIYFFLYQQKFLKVPYFHQVSEILYVVPIFVPMPHSSPFLPLLNRYLRRIAETGILQKMIGDTAEDGILSGEIRFFKSTSDDAVTLTLKHFLLAFVLWAIGLINASFIFFAEFRKWRKDASVKEA